MRTDWEEAEEVAEEVAVEARESPPLEKGIPESTTAPNPLVPTGKLVPKSAPMHGQSKPGGHCTPKCTWSCETPTCDEVCEPVCKTPRCETRCAGPSTSGCSMHCSEPHCALMCPKSNCPSDGCPSCSTKCSEPQCKLQCPKTQQCETVCAQPQCDWSCKAPSDCPKPKCSMICESPKKCQSSSFSAELPPLKPGQIAVQSFKAPSRAARSSIEEQSPDCPNCPSAQEVEQQAPETQEGRWKAARPGAPVSNGMMNVHVRSAGAPHAKHSAHGPWHKIVSMPVL